MSAKKKKEAAVRRITIDEKLYDDLIRIEVCDLASGVDRFNDSSEYWVEMAEEEKRITRDDYAEVMGIPKEQLIQWQWKDLEEGQVFLSGSFKKVEDENSADAFTVVPDIHDFMRIDDIVKKEIKKLYYDVLRRKE
jgi:hypothetical protein